MVTRSFRPFAFSKVEKAFFYFIKGVTILIEIINLTKSFNDGEKTINAVNNVSLKINKGEIFGIIGLSGAGKSTLIRCLNRLEEADSGKIFVEDIELTSLDRDDLRKERKDMGMIFQHFNLLSQKTVFDNIAFPLQLGKKNKREIGNKVDELLQYVGLKDKKYNYPSQLSGGQKQRVAIARALANNPKILLSDEGTSALDPQTTESILNLLKRIRDEFGITIVMITHQMEVVKDMCDRVAIMDNGKVIEENTVENIFRDPKTKIARSFIDSLQGNIQEEIINPQDFKGKIIRLTFLGDSAKKPIVSNVIKNFDIHINILSGNINKLQLSSVGHLILELIGEDAEIHRALTFLKDENVHVEVI